VITTPTDRCQFERLLGDGAQWGIRLSYAEQVRPAGLAEAFIIGADFIGRDRVAMVLGDNIFFGHGLSELLASAAARGACATVFAYTVRQEDTASSILMKVGSKRSRRSQLRTGQSPVSYFFDNRVVQYARHVEPSPRGELEITDLQMRYLSANALHVERMGRGFAWLDTGTVESLIEAASFVQTLETRQGMKVGCLEEIAFRMGFIDEDEVIALAKPLEKSGYGKYLIELVERSPSRRNTTAMTRELNPIRAIN
jgi:glucose-1-phosphate thymidylyltransferase